MKIKFLTKLILFSIIILAATLRFYGLNWDQGHHLHPDERAIIMTVDGLSFPKTVEAFLSVDSPWNPHFFAYGSLPFYLLFIVSQLLTPVDPHLAEYMLLDVPGRFISTISDLATILILFLLGKKLFNKKVGLIAALFYSISVLPIQLSHFYAVDTLLTLFIVTTLYQLIIFYEKPTIKRAILIGVLFGMSLATKISATVLAVSVGASLAADFLLLFFKQPHKPHHYLPQLPKFIKHLLIFAGIIGLTTLATFLFFEPYALIDFKNFLLHTQQQSAMTRDAFTFPYTLQYVNKIPYIYELKNIFLFGLGPIIATAAFLGFFFFLNLSIKKNKQEKWAQEAILLVFFVAYFFTVGNFAIGFMRYMLPVYPLLCLFAALFIVTLFQIMKQKIKNTIILNTLYLILYTATLIWPLSFIQIYTHNNTRVDATNWIGSHIPPETMLLVEHWDDRLPLSIADQYIIEDLELYNPDTPEKWIKIYDQLQRAKYIIIASNRLYTPLPKLTNCDELPEYRCYQQTATYYENLFSGKLGFQKVVSFTNYPTIPFTNITINDQSADESFTVYDHPKVIIFQKKSAE